MAYFFGATLYLLSIFSAEINSEFDDTAGWDCLLSASGVDYMGRHNRTATGAACQRWSDKQPHSHEYDDVTFFADFRANSSAELVDVANFCRNPSISTSAKPQPWCYTTLHSQLPDEFEYCDVPRCKRKQMLTRV